MCLILVLPITARQALDTYWLEKTMITAVKNVFNNCINRKAKWAIDFNSYYHNSAPTDNNIMTNCIIDNAQNLINSQHPN